MEPKHLSYFKVENFKRFDSLEVKDIGQFNLVVGDNNVGKTTLLEALLFDDENYNQFIYNTWMVLDLYRKIEIQNAELINYLDFYLRDKTKSIDFAFQFLHQNKPSILSLKKKSIDKLTESEIDKLKYVLRIHKGDRHLIEFSLNEISEMKFLSYETENESYTDYLPFIGYSLIYNEKLTNLFSELIISTLKKDGLIDNLKYFLPNLVSIEINNAIVPKKSIIGIREINADLKPLSEYGDGVIKLFRYLLELDLCENNRLMIDEIDTGIHYSRMKEFFKKVLHSAKNKNVQIFATTHSKECLVYYTKALEELGYQDNGRVIKIADTKSGIKAYTSRFAEFENSLFNDSEIR